jgi:hypothetical protein
MTNSMWMQMPRWLSSIACTQLNTLSSLAYHQTMYNSILRQQFGRPPGSIGVHRSLVLLTSQHIPSPQLFFMQRTRPWIFEHQALPQTSFCFLSFPSFFSLSIPSQANAPMWLSLEDQISGRSNHYVMSLAPAPTNISVRSLGLALCAT